MSRQPANGGQIVPRQGSSVRESATGTEMVVRGETAAETMAARAQAEVYGAMQLAKKFPRDMGHVRTKILAECSRPEFAVAALYSLPRGEKKVEGPTIRFAEALMRLLGNIYTTSAVIYDDPEKRIIQVRATDLESNITITDEASIEKTTERKKLRRGQKPIEERYNSFGDRVYIVEATEDDVRQKQAVAVSKAMRTCVLRLTPADIVEESKRMIRKTLADQFNKGGDDIRRRMVDSFAKSGVDTPALDLYLGHPLAKATSAEVDDLRQLYSAIKEEHTTWSDALAWKLETDGRAPVPADVVHEQRPAADEGKA